MSEMDISPAIKQLKFNKSDGDDMGMMSNHTIHSSDIFKKSLAKMFTAVLTHGYQPKTVLLATIASIPKDSRGNICSGNNYRGITICSSIAKLMDTIMINRIKINFRQVTCSLPSKRNTVLPCIVWL